MNDATPPDNPPAPGHNSGTTAANKLRSFIERIERLLEEKAELQADITEVFAEAKGNGFDTKIMRQIIKLRAMEENERAEYEALLDVYKAGLGMLAGTSLGAAATKRLRKRLEDRKDEAATAAAAQAPLDHDEDEESAPPLPPDELAELTIEDARVMGAADAMAGKPVTSNRFPARDPRRSAYDEAWCQSAGSDGMDIPEAWRRTPKPKKKATADSAGGQGSST